MMVPSQHHQERPATGGMKKTYLSVWDNYQTIAWQQTAIKLALIALRHSHFQPESLALEENFSLLILNSASHGQTQA